MRVKRRKGKNRGMRGGDKVDGVGKKGREEGNVELER